MPPLLLLLKALVDLRKTNQCTVDTHWPLFLIMLYCIQNILNETAPKIPTEEIQGW